MSEHMKKPKPVTDKKKIDILGWTGSIAIVVIFGWLTWSNLENFIIKYKGERVTAQIVELPAICGPERGNYPEMVVEVYGKSYLVNLTHYECLNNAFSIGDTLQVTTHRYFDRAIRPDVNHPEIGLLVLLGLIIGWAIILYTRRR